jgi:Chaperone of endosialidase
MEQPTNKSSRAISLSLAAGLVITLLTAGTVRLAGAQSNTSLGTSALAHDVAGVGIDNTGLGFAALFLNQTGSNNTAIGAGVLQSNSVDDNTGVGYRALLDNTTGLLNTAAGADALLSNTTGNYNTATGAEALTTNTSGSLNAADGFDALTSNTTGSGNIAPGYQALYSNATGGNNTAVGFSALEGNSTGSDNVAIGSLAGVSLTTGNPLTGNGNIAIGGGAGDNLTTGNNNIDIGNQGIAGESGIIRIGTKGTQTRAFIASVNSSPIFGVPVVVNTNGRLGIQASSARYKHDIRDMGDASDKLMKLRPVSFRYKSDPEGTLQYGLVAEEVARVYRSLSPMATTANRNR